MTDERERLAKILDGVANEVQATADKIRHKDAVGERMRDRATAFAQAAQLIRDAPPAEPDPDDGLSPELTQWVRDDLESLFSFVVAAHGALAADRRQEADTLTQISGRLVGIMSVIDDAGDEAEGEDAT